MKLFQWLKEFYNTWLKPMNRPSKGMESIEKESTIESRLDPETVRKLKEMVRK